MVNRGAIESQRSKILLVDDTIKALGQFAHQYRLKNNFKVIAITGSVGKTTTRQIVYHVLSKHYRCRQAPKNFNNDIGLPLTLLGASAEEKIIVAELGSNYPGEIAYLAQIAQPDVAVVTNVHPAHLAGFGDLEAIIQEKLSISEGLREDGVLIINGDLAPLAETCRTAKRNFVTFGRGKQCDIQAVDVTFSNSGSRFVIDGTEISLSLPGPGNIENALAAWSVCSRFGISIDDFACAVGDLSAVAMRTELLQAGTLTILNDCYNANPASMRNALEILANFGRVKTSRLVFICGDMAELADKSCELHTELGSLIAQAKVQLLLTVGEYAKITAQAAKRKADYKLQTKLFKDTLSVCNMLPKLIKDNDIILLKGSRAAKLEMAVEKLKELF